jgi:hypothetical protein
MVERTQKEVEERVAIVIPIHPKHFQFAYKLIDKRDVMRGVCDVILVFSNEHEENLFQAKDKVKSIVLEINTKTGNIVTFKKFYALEQMMDSEYDYFVVCDAETDIIAKNFTRQNLLAKLKGIFDNGKVYAGVCPNLKEITKSSASVFSDPKDVDRLKHITMEHNLYYWWSDIPVYRRSDLKDFFAKISYANINWHHFDHKIYLNYLLLYQEFKIVNITNELGIYWSLENYNSTNIGFLKGEGYGFGWITPNMFRNNTEAMLNEGALFLYHLDRN